METVDEAMNTMKKNNRPYEELENLLMVMSRGLVDNPDEVVVFPAKGSGFVHFEVRCEDRDLGALIGKRGSHAGFMRSILSASAAIRNIRVTVQFISHNDSAAR